MTRKFKIWAVSEGPTSVIDLISNEDYEFDIPEDGEYLVVCKVEEDSRLREEEFWFATEEQAYKFKNYIDGRMEALEVSED